LKADGGSPDSGFNRTRRKLFAVPSFLGHTPAVYHTAGTHFRLRQRRRKSRPSRSDRVLGYAALAVLVLFAALVFGPVLSDWWGCGYRGLDSWLPEPTSFTIQRHLEFLHPPRQSPGLAPLAGRSVPPCAGCQGQRGPSNCRCGKSVKTAPGGAFRLTGKSLAKGGLRPAGEIAAVACASKRRGSARVAVKGQDFGAPCHI